MSNTTTNQTANETINPVSSWEMPDIRGILSGIENAIMEKLIDWGYDPAHTMFWVVVLLGLAFIYNWMTSRATTKLQGGNKYLLLIILFIGVLWFLEVI
jgi:hypothetical protein